MAKIPLSMIQDISLLSDVVTVIPDFTLSNNTPNGRFLVPTTSSGGHNTADGVMLVSFDMYSNGYMSNNPNSHLAIVLRQDPATESTYVRGQGCFFGHFTTFSNKAVLESWQNGLGARENYVWEASATPDEYPVEDGKYYRFQVESVVAPDLKRYLRMVVQLYVAANDQYTVIRDTGFVSDANTLFDATKTGLMFGYVFATQGTSWNVSFTNISVTWSKSSRLGFNGLGIGEATIPGAVPSLTYYNDRNILSTTTESLKLTGGVASVLNNLAIGTPTTPVLAVRDTRGNSTVGAAGVFGSGIEAITHTNGVQAESSIGVLSTSNNYSTSSYCASAGGYFRGYQRATGTVQGANGYGNCWGSVSEVKDMTYGVELNRSIAGTGITCLASGENTKAFGATITVGDSKLLDTGVASSFVRADSGLFISSGATASRWREGTSITDYSDSGISVYNYAVYNKTGVHPANGIKVQGNHSVAMITIKNGVAPTGIDLTTGNSFTNNIAIKLAYGQKLDFGTGYPTWPTWANTAMPGEYDCADVVPDNLTSHSRFIETILKILGHLMKEEKAKGILK